ncbi:MAG: hypothetical protein NUV80_04095 [Candidatus Berkelbacteria bacterium]|nr:hypothetical protein [Candidatus Berkelbacteria bacterium]
MKKNTISEPIFVNVRNDSGDFYDSYDIIYQLIRLSEFETCELDEVKPESKNIYIFPINNGNVAACCERPHKARYILWNIEIPGQVEVRCPDYMDEMWVSCQYFYSLIPEKKKFVPLGGHPGLIKEPFTVKKWDFCHLSYIYGKRAEQVAKLESEGFTMAPIGWGEVRDDSVACSRWGLCLHQHAVPALSPQRMTLFACRKLPIVIEECDPYPYQVVKLQDFNRGLDFSSIIEQNFILFTEKYTFRNMVEAAL